MLLARTAEHLNEPSGRLSPPHKKKDGACRPLCGGDKRIRTAGLLVANEALYQLSHIPENVFII